MPLDENRSEVRLVFSQLVVLLRQDKAAVGDLWGQRYCLRRGSGCEQVLNKVRRDLRLDLLEVPPTLNIRQEGDGVELV